MCSVFTTADRPQLRIITAPLFINTFKHFLLCAFALFLQETVYWTSLRNSCPCQTTCLVPAITCTASASSPSARAPSPARTCSPAPNCGALGRPVASWSAKQDTSPGRMAPAVATAKSATEECVLIRTAPSTSR